MGSLFLDGKSNCQGALFSSSRLGGFAALRYTALSAVDLVVDKILSGDVVSAIETSLTITRAGVLPKIPAISSCSF